MEIFGCWWALVFSLAKYMDHVMCRKANFGDAMQSTALYMGDLPNWTHQVNGYMASKQRPLQSPEDADLWQILFYCVIDIAHLTPYRISRLLSRSRESNPTFKDVLAAPWRQASCNESVEVCMLVFASIHVELMVKEPKLELFIAQSLRG